MEILALYTSPETLSTAIAAGARHLAATLEGFALVYFDRSRSGEPDGWSGFTCAKDAATAGAELESFREQTLHSERPLRCDAPTDPARIWSRAAGGVYGFPLRHGGKPRGVAIVGCPGPWPRMRSAEFESIVRQITLMLDHHAVSQGPTGAGEPSEEFLRLSEQLLAQDIELLRQDERIGQVEQVKNDLIEKMSCELRTPLNAISERVVSVLAGEHENLSPAGREALREALDAGNALFRILQNILDLWRLRQHAVRVEIQDVNLREVMDEAVFNIRESLKENVALETHLNASVPKVRTDLSKLNQILFQLLDNAAKFTREGKIEVEISVEDGQLLGVISDTGIGIAADDHEQVFDEFFQVDSSPTSRTRGAGLGLTLVRALVELMGGALSFTSEIGRGSRFSFTLPVES